MKFEKGRTIFLLDNHNDFSGFEINLDKDRELDKGDEFIWFSDKKCATKLLVIEFSDLALFCREQ